VSIFLFSAAPVRSARLKRRRRSYGDCAILNELAACQFVSHLCYLQIRTFLDITDRRLNDKRGVVLLPDSIRVTIEMPRTNTGHSMPASQCSAKTAKSGSPEKMRYLAGGRETCGLYQHKD